MAAQMHRIVILGAGFAGLTLALELERRCGRMGACEILLLDKSGEHLYTPLLYEVATGSVEEAHRACAGELRAGVCVRFDTFTTILGAKHIRFRRVTVVGIDREESCVRVEGGPSIPYDELVIALGSETATYGIPGLDVHAIAMKNLPEALRIRDRLYRLFTEYKKGKRKEIRVVVGGAGATGTEFSAEVANFFDRLVHAGVLRADAAKVILVEAAPTILSMLPPHQQEAARERLQRLHVEVKTTTAIDHVAADGVFVKPALPPGTPPAEHPELTLLAADLVVWTGGIKPASVLASFALPMDKKGKITVDPTGRVSGCEHVYALGDCAAYLDPAKHQPVPALAQAAIAQAKVVAENIARAAEGKPLLPFRSAASWPTIIPLGGKYAIANLYGLSFMGWPAYLIRKVADLRYFLSILPPHYALHMWMRGAKMYIQND